MRTTRTLPCQSWLRSASTIFPRAAGFSSGAHASSRSRKTSSAALDAAFSIIRGLLPGTARTDRRRRALDTGRLLRRRSGLVVRRGGSILGRRRAVVERDLTGVGWNVSPVRVHARNPTHAAEETAQHLLKLLRAAEVVLHALEHAGHQLLELRVLGELLLEPAQLGHELLHLDFLSHLHQDRLRCGCSDHLHLLTHHLESLAGHACALVLAPAELGLELVQLRMDPAEV